MSGIGPGSGTRATLRLARRDAWRNRGRSALIALMIALPVLAVSAISVVYRSDQRDPQDYVTAQLGADTRNQAWISGRINPVVQSVDGAHSRWSGISPDRPVERKEAETWLTSALPPGNALLERHMYHVRGTFTHAGRPLSTDAVEEFDYPAAGAEGPVRQVSGRAPRSSTEVVVTEHLARSDHLRPGDELVLWVNDGTSRRMSVVGVVGGVSLIGQSEVIAQPGTLPPEPDWAYDPSRINWLVVGPTGVNWRTVQKLNTAGFVVTSRAVVANPPPSAQVPFGTGRVLYSPSADQAGEGRLWTTGSLPYVASPDLVGVITVAIGLVLLQIALLAGPAIAVGARRNERTLALMAANGGNPRQLRSVVLASSGVIGLVSSAVAALLGAGIGALAVPLLRRYGDLQLVRVDVHPLDLAVLVAVGTFTAVAAAIIPARQAARLDVVATLTGRRGRPSPPLRIPVIGVLVALAGCAVCYVGATRTEPFLTVAGIAIAEVGLVTLTGALIALAARGAGRLPFAARFALRDAARQRSRTAPAVAAVMAAIAGSVAVGVYLQSGHADKQDSYLPAAELGTTDVTFSAVPGAKSPDGSVALTPLVDAATTSATVAAIQRVLPVQQVAVYQTVTYGQIGVSLLDDEGKQPLDLHDPEVYANYAGPFSGFFDDGSALQVRAGAQDPAAVSALRSGKVVIYDPRWWYSDGRVRVRVEQPASKGHARRVHTVKLPAVLLTSRPAVAFPIFPPSAAKALGVQISPVGVVASTTRVPSKHEQHALTQAVNKVQPASVSVERGYQGGFPIGLLALVVAAALVTLGGTFAAVGLAAAEGRTDVATLAAVGAGPFVRRRVAAAQAAVITVLAAPLGLITGLLAGWALVRLHGGTNWPSSDTFSDWRQAYFNGWPFAVPWPAVIALVVGVPMLAIVVAFVTTRSRLPLVRRLGQ